MYNYRSAVEVELCNSVRKERERETETVVFLYAVHKKYKYSSCYTPVKNQ